ncbi:MAG: hypothetical protein AAGK78_07430 [Planctomycetota bacterium]
MSTDTEELAEVAEKLSPEQRGAVKMFAMFLLSQKSSGQSEEDGDAAWERIIADPRPRPKLEAFAKAALAEGTEPLDPEKL